MTTQQIHTYTPRDHKSLVRINPVALADALDMHRAKTGMSRRGVAREIGAHEHSITARLYDARRKPDKHMTLAFAAAIAEVIYGDRNAWIRFATMPSGTD